MKRRLLIVGVLTLAAVAAWTVWPRGERLVLFTSEPMTPNGHPVQLRVLMPDGWVADKPKFIGPDVWGFTSTTMKLHPKRGFLWLPRFLTWAMGNEPTASLELEVGSYGPKVDLWQISFRNPSENQSYCIAMRANRDDPDKSAEQNSTVYYYRNNKRNFDKTYRQVCESFQVIR